MLTNDQKKLVDLSEKYLNEEGQQAILDLLAEEKENLARIYIYAALDKLVEREGLPGEEASPIFKFLDLNPADVERLRQRHAASK